MRATRQVVGALLATLAALTVGACGLNAVRVQSGGQVGAMAASVSGEAKATIDAADQRREAAWASLIASDPSCGASDTLYILVPDRPGLAQTSLCGSGANPRVPDGYSLAEAYGGPVPSRAVKPTLDLIGAVAVYGAAMSRIANEPRLDVTADVDKAISLATKAGAVAGALGASGLPNIGALTADQKSSSVAIVNFLGNLAHEQRQKDKIATLYRKDNAAILAELDKLSIQLDNWRDIATSWSQVEIISLQRAYQAQNRAQLSFEERRSLVAEIRAAQREPARIKAAGVQMQQAIALLKQNQQDLGKALDGPTAAQRRAAAEINRKRAVTALGLIADSVIAWAGA